MADIVRNVMEETGISVTDLILVAIDIAHLEYPSELVSHRDEIIQSLYVGVKCAECNNIDEIQDLTIDQGKANVSGPPKAVVEGNNDEEVPSEKKTGLKVVIRLKKNKNLTAKATETPQYGNSEAKTTKSSNSTGLKTDDYQLQNLSVKATEGPKSKMNQFQSFESGNEEFIQRFESAKRKLRDGYEMAACAKKQRTVKLLSTNELPKQGTTGMLSRKGVVRTQISSTSNVGRGKVLPKHCGRGKVLPKCNRLSKLQMLRKTLKSRF